MEVQEIDVVDNAGLLGYLYPEVINHPEQAYLTTEQGKTWLEN